MELNYFAILVAALAAMVVGGLWYSPVLFGKRWMTLRGQDPTRMQGMSFPKKEMLIQFIASLITAYVLALFASALSMTTPAYAVLFGFWVWLGFYATTMLDPVLWEKGSWSLYILNASQRLVSILAMALIIGLWR